MSAPLLSETISHSSSTEERNYASPHSSADEEYDSDEPPELVLDLENLKTCASNALSASCISVRKLTRGRFHEIFVLEFDRAPDLNPAVAKANYTCIARLTRGKENLDKAKSELATTRYVRDHTFIPVAEIFYDDLRPDNPVGAPVVLMERLPGQHLYKFWDEITLDHKEEVLTQIATVLTQLATLKFNQIGSLREDGSLGPLEDECLPPDNRGPFESTLDYMSAYIRENDVESPKLKDLYSQIHAALEQYLSSQADTAYLNSPFRLIHPDFDAQNFLFTRPPVDSKDPPWLSGVLDFENAYTGPLYFLYEYPIFIQDVDYSPELYEQNSILRPRFVQSLRHGFTKGSREYSLARDVMRQKNFILNEFKRAFMLVKMDDGMMEIQATSFLEQLRNGTGRPYTARPGYKPDEEIVSDEE